MFAHSFSGCDAIYSFYGDVVGVFNDRLSTHDEAVESNLFLPSIMLQQLKETSTITGLFNFPKISVIQVLL